MPRNLFYICLCLPGLPGKLLWGRTPERLGTHCLKKHGFKSRRLCMYLKGLWGTILNPIWSFNEKFYNHTLILLLTLKHYPNRPDLISVLQPFLTLRIFYWDTLNEQYFFDPARLFIFPLELPGKMINSFFSCISLSVSYTWLEETGWHV